MESQAQHFARRDFPLDQPNSGQGDGYRSGTNVKGSIVKLSYSPFDMLTLSATWFRTSLINGQLISANTTWDSTMNRLQIDAMLKF